MDGVRKSPPEGTALHNRFAVPTILPSLSHPWISSRRCLNRKTIANELMKNRRLITLLAQPGALFSTRRFVCQSIDHQAVVQSTSSRILQDH